MTQSSGQSSGSGPDLLVPDEILKVIPTDPYDQLDLARKITSMAIASRVSKMDTEMTRMRRTLYEKDKLIFELEEKVMGLNRTNQDAESRLKNALDENARLSKERDQLAITAKKLSRDLVKLETFKRQLMQSLNNDNLSPTETVDIGTCEQPALKGYANKEDGADGDVAYHSYNGSGDVGNTKADEASRIAGHKFSLTPYINPRLPPTVTPNLISAAVSPRAYSTIPTPQKSPGTTSPTNISYDVRGSYSSWFPSSQQSSAANSPPRARSQTGRPPRIDGKEFFRQARSRLSYEQFSAFLANIKELNAHKQTREETLRKAEQIFGTDDKDLYLTFQGLLSRNVQ